MITVRLVGGSLDGALYALPDPPGHPRPVVLVNVPFTWTELLPAPDPAPGPWPVGVYELVRHPDSYPALADDGTYRYAWKGIR